MSYPIPALLPETEQKKTVVAVELAPDPRTCGELWGYVESWGDEVAYLLQDPEKYVKEIAYARFMAERFAWVVLELRKRPEYTSEFCFAPALIDALMLEYDEQFPDKVAPEYKRLPEELEEVFDDVLGICRNLNEKLKAGKPISKDDIFLKKKTEPEWDTGSNYQDDFEKLKEYRSDDDDKEIGGSFVGV